MPPQRKSVISVGHNGTTKTREVRTNQHLSDSAPGSNDESSMSPHKTGTQESSGQEGQLCMENEQQRLEIEGTRSVEIRPSSKRFDLNICWASIPGDIMIVRGTLNMLGSSAFLGEFYDLLHTLKGHEAKSEDEHRKILFFLESTLFQFTKLYKEFELFYEGSVHFYPARFYE